MNFQQLADHAESILKGLNDGSVKTVDAKEQINTIGKMTNIYKAKLDYNLNRHKVKSIDFFEDNIEN
jgi:hypothetical protein